jgi:hypothetical protein
MPAETMNNKVELKRKKRYPYWQALLLGILITCIASNVLTILFQFGTFTPWKALPRSPSKAVHIIEADPDNIWIELEDKRIFALTMYCYQNKNCYHWQIVNNSAEINPINYHQVQKEKDCTSISDFPGNPWFGKVSECILAPAYGVPDPEWGYETYFVLMEDGTVRYWQNGNGILSFYFFFILSTIVLPLAVAIIITITYLILFIVRKFKNRPRSAVVSA